jgi:hypothetical protein
MGLRLESFQNFNVGGGRSAPELYTVGPDGWRRICLWSLHVFLIVLIIWEIISLSRTALLHGDSNSAKVYLGCGQRHVLLVLFVNVGWCCYVESEQQLMKPCSTSWWGPLGSVECFPGLRQTFPSLCRGCRQSCGDLRFSRGLIFTISVTVP